MHLHLIIINLWLKYVIKFEKGKKILSIFFLLFYYYLSNMMFRPPRGTKDLLPSSLSCRRYIESIFASTCKLWGFSEIEVPILERQEIFNRTLGETSDVVHKEMFYVRSSSGSSTSTTNANEELCLRPEGTSSIVRAALFARVPLPVDWYYHGPMFRYERPQRGRLREFHQFGIESLGKSEPQDDVDCMILAHQCLLALQQQQQQSSSSHHTIKLEINSLGDVTDREHYSTILQAHFEKYRVDLSVDSLFRLNQHRPFRILDSKSPQDQPIIESCPSFYETSMSVTSKKRFETVQYLLENAHVPFICNEKLVRGLDYYSHSVFEFTTTSTTTNNNNKDNQTGTVNTMTLLAGGRYDHLAKILGHDTSIPAIGWAAGLERLVGLFFPSVVLDGDTSISTAASANTTTKVLIYPMQQELFIKNVSFFYNLTHQLRQHQIPCTILHPQQGNSNKMSRILNQAEHQIQATHVIVIGTREIETKMVNIKKLSPNLVVNEKKGTILIRDVKIDDIGDHIVNK
jgi:histidyl-tRNA synthetase